MQRLPTRKSSVHAYTVHGDYHDFVKFATAEEKSWGKSIGQNVADGLGRPAFSETRRAEQENGDIFRHKMRDIWSWPHRQRARSVFLRGVYQVQYYVPTYQCIYTVHVLLVGADLYMYLNKFMYIELLLMYVLICTLYKYMEYIVLGQPWMHEYGYILWLWYIVLVPRILARDIPATKVPVPVSHCWLAAQSPVPSHHATY